MFDDLIGRASRLAALALCVFALGLVLALPDEGSLVPQVAAQEGGTVPGAPLGNTSDSEFWRQIRGGAQGSVTIPDPNAARLIQSEGENWRNFRNGPLSTIGIWLLVGMIVVLALFFAIRGRIKIDSGLSGRTIERFNNIERFAHWLTAGSFIVLAITGLNIMYGRYLFGGLPADPGQFGALHEVFAAVTYYGKFVHNFVSFAFMAGLILIIVLWVRDNIPNRLDLKWLAVGGGLFRKNVHPPAKKFNAGQKFFFWIVVLGGISMSLSGLSLLLPFTLKLFGWVFAVLNFVGFGVPAELTLIEEMQLSQLSHALVSVAMTALMIAHIYIGSLGMQGAFDAMGSGMVDENWAREHHGLWVAEVKGEAPPPEDHGAGGEEAKADSGKESPQTA